MDSTGTCTDHVFRPRGAALRGGYCYASFLPHILTPEHPIRTPLIRRSPHTSAVFQRVPARTPHVALRYVHTELRSCDPRVCPHHRCAASGMCRRTWPLERAVMRSLWNV